MAPEKVKAMISPKRAKMAPSMATSSASTRGLPAAALRRAPTNRPSSMQTSIPARRPSDGSSVTITNVIPDPDAIHPRPTCHGRAGRRMARKANATLGPGPVEAYDHRGGALRHQTMKAYLPAIAALLALRAAAQEDAPRKLFQ